MYCYICSVQPKENTEHPHEVSFLYKPHKNRGFWSERVCEQCYIEMKEGRLTEFGGCYGYRGKLLDDGTFYPHTRLIDGSLQPITPTDETYYGTPDSSGYFFHDRDIGKSECYRERIGGPLLFKKGDRL